MSAYKTLVWFSLTLKEILYEATPTVDWFDYVSYILYIFAWTKYAMSLCTTHQFIGQMPYELGKVSWGGKGISSASPAQCCLSSDWLADNQWYAFTLTCNCDTHIQKLIAIFIQSQPAVLICASQSNCVQVLLRWIWMAQKKPTR